MTTVTTRSGRAGVHELVAEARAWFDSLGLEPAPPDVANADLSVFRDLPHEREAELIARLTDWQRRKFEAGFGAIEWPVELGGRGLTIEHARAFAELETEYTGPDAHELPSVTLHLVAPTLQLLAETPELHALIEPMLSGDLLACQLFSEPSAGSDLAALGTRARREGDEWVVTGQKVWTSGAQFAQWGELIARTDPAVPKHRGMTAFMVPLDAEGVEVRPLRQMSGGSSFNEVFLDEVRIPDTYRISDVGAGWKVALTTLGFERSASGGDSRVGGSVSQLVELARSTGALQDPVLRGQLADVVIADRLAAISRARDEASEDWDATAVAGSMRKLQWVNRLRGISAFAQAAAGRLLVVDHGSGEFAWTKHVLGAPGYRIAGGSDEIQRNLIAERMLGLPAEPRVDKGVAWQDVPR